MKPYYDHAGIRIYHADCRGVLPSLGPVDVVVTDPVWPNAVISLAGADDPEGLFREAAAHFPRLASRLVVHLGSDSDPRFLRAVPPELPFFRACWLDYAVPSFKGRILYMADVAYAFGAPPPVRNGQALTPGRCESDGSFGRTPGHPCPRQLHHARWLLKWFARGTVLDPFMGIGTTLVAAKESGLPAVGVEVCEEYCERAADRLRQDLIPGLLKPPRRRKERPRGSPLFDVPAPKED